MVSAPDGEQAAIIFADSNIQARKWGASEWNDGELGGMSCNRLPAFDRFEKTGVPASEMVEIGWWFECSSCGGRIDLDDTEDRGVVAADVVGTQHGAVYCNEACRDEHKSRVAREKVAGDAFLEMLRARVRRRFGDVEFTTGAFREHMFAQEVDGKVVIKDACIAFNFPGQKIAPASVHYQPGYKIGPVALETRCCAGDKEAFEAFAAASAFMARVAEEAMK